MITLESVTLPDLACPEPAPELPLALYHQRWTELEARMRRAGLDVLAVYADREHWANLGFLTGFHPCFEEALLLADTHGRRTILLGNECVSWPGAKALGCDKVLFQDFSLLGQPRDRSAPLAGILSGFGIGPGTRVGCAGWKYCDGDRIPEPALASELPSYLVDALRAQTGDPRRVTNANALFMNPADGLRVINEADQIAPCEYAATVVSRSVRALLETFRVGIEERDAARALDSRGLPLSCHPIVSFGDRTRYPFQSPTANRARLGDPFLAGFSVDGALTARTGHIAHAVEDLPAALRDFYPRFAAAYFETLAAWYAAVRVGAPAREVFQAVERARPADVFDLALNPGHYIHLDEWVHSPFSAASDVTLRSGMLLQSDLIPVSRGPGASLYGEDGIALADDELRRDLAERFPEAWARIGQRQRFVRETIGVPLDDSVLPLSNLCLCLAPYALSPERILVRR